MGKGRGQEQNDEWCRLGQGKQGIVLHHPRFAYKTRELT